MTDKQVCDLLNTRMEISFQLAKFDSLPLKKRMRVLSLRNRKTSYGPKVLIEIENDEFLFLPSRYTDLFIKNESDNFFVRTPTLHMTIVDFFNEINDKGEPFSTPVLTFSCDGDAGGNGVKRSFAAAKTGNSSIDALNATSKAFDSAAQQKGGGVGKEARRLNFDEKKQKQKQPPPPQESQAWDDGDETE